MASIIVLALVAALFVLFLALQFVWRHPRKDERESSHSLIEVDLDAFENLTDPEEEKYLKINLTPAEFRRVQRSRIRAAKAYVQALSQNASALVAVGQSARHNPDKRIAASAQQLVQRAVQLKMRCLASALRLNAALVFPGFLSPSSSVAGRYLAAKHVAATLNGGAIAKSG
jgi:hypothetical protein